MKPLKRQYPLIALGFMIASSSVLADVTLFQSGDNVTMSNDQLSITINTTGANVTDIHSTGGINLVENLSALHADPANVKTFYLDYHTGVSGGGKSFVPTDYKVVSQSNSQVHIMFTGADDAYLELEYHFILRDGMSGIYSYVVAKNPHDTTQRVAELRTVYRFDARVMDTVFNGKHSATPLLYAQLDELTKIQDETWQLNDGSYYSKYDLANYTREAPFWGVYGGGYGAWMIPASHDYYPGDPQMQELIVHQDGIALNYLTGAHLGSPDMQAPSGWEKLYGPWLVYVNQGTASEMRKDAALQAQRERQQWPYQWMNDDRYPLERSTLSGSIKSKYPVELVLTSATGEDFDTETLGYSYSVKPDKKGRFTLKHIRPGDYQLTAYPLSGPQTGAVIKKALTISGKHQTIKLVVPRWKRHVLWQIGQSNRRADEFALAHEDRNYRWKEQVPENLTYTIGKSRAHRDWYYAQTQVGGSWNVDFKLRHARSARLDVAFAAASNSGMTDPTTPTVDVLVNGKSVTTLAYENDKAIYRSALQSGRYHRASITIPANLLKRGKNQISFKLEGGAVMYDTLVLSQGR
ncbi:hypothetical protein LDJ79_20690 [Vibrio tritonius]|uniref:Rhamnogalacturonan endolyase n=1 Tax=Vibrio tritonius TaxID=1435069 RepID=A0ABS7YW37_9VIBR|nr:polysaccharide lyase family protein [Vibrio tritonius]MCA2018545.1 hypothetical protein [Vibrio tritonius]